MSTLPVPRPAETMASKAPAARASSLSKVYGEGETSVVALDAVDVSIERERFTAVRGPSGPGKPTFMPCLGGLDPAPSGRVGMGAVALPRLKDDDLTRLRRDAVGFIFQAYNLVPTLTALE